MISKIVEKEQLEEENKAYKIIILALLGLVIAGFIVVGWLSGREANRYYCTEVYNLNENCKEGGEE